MSYTIHHVSSSPFAAALSVEFLLLLFTVIVVVVVVIIIIIIIIICMYTCKHVCTYVYV